MKTPITTEVMVKSLRERAISGDLGKLLKSRNHLADEHAPNEMPKVKRIPTMMRAGRKSQAL